MQCNTHPIKGIYLNPWLDPIACIAIQIIIIALHANLSHLFISITYLLYYIYLNNKE